MADKIYCVTDIGPGDGGKGGVVDAIAERQSASIIIKEGGAQGSHGVLSRDGRRFNFSQWGCGTFNQIPTYLSKRFVMSPVGLINESAALRKTGIYNPFWLLSADPECICATPYHRVWSQLYELSLKEQAHGTVGTGIGKAYHMAEHYPDITIRAKDLTNRETVTAKLAAIRDYVIETCGRISASDILLEDRDYWLDNRRLLFDRTILDQIANDFCYIGQQLQLRELHEVMASSRTIVVERSHGVLTDNECGLKPHVSSLRTLPLFSRQMYAEAGFSGKFVNLAVHRAYEIRHGAGPLPTRDDELREKLLPGSHKDTNRWQGEVRVGALDVPLMHHAIKTCEPIKFDGLCMTWFDQILKNGEWPICGLYLCNGNIIMPGTQLSTRTLKLITPLLITHNLGDVTRFEDPKQLFGFCQDVMARYTDIPLRMVSYGPSAAEKIFQ